VRGRRPAAPAIVPVDGVQVLHRIMAWYGAASSSRSALRACASSSPATSTKASVSVARLSATRS